MNGRTGTIGACKSVGNQCTASNGLMDQEHGPGALLGAVQDPEDAFRSSSAIMAMCHALNLSFQVVAPPGLTPEEVASWPPSEESDGSSFIVNTRQEDTDE